MTKKKMTTRRATTILRVSHYELPAYQGAFQYGIGQTVSRWLVYGLTDPDTKVVRYIGRSFTGLARPCEHRLRISRERTYKANWIRSLIKAGKMYGVRVLEECTGVVETIEAEVKWIAEGHQLGWPLTNLTSGGEGAAGKKVQLPDAEIARAYIHGESELSLAKRFAVNRWTITRRLLEFGIERRNGSQANTLRMARMTPAERLALCQPAHEAMRGRKRTPHCSHCGSSDHNIRRCTEAGRNGSERVRVDFTP